MQLLNTYIFDILVFSILTFHPNIIILAQPLGFLYTLPKYYGCSNLRSLIYNIFFNWTRFNCQHKLIFNSKKMVQSCKWLGQDLHELGRAPSLYLLIGCGKAIMLTRAYA